MEVILGQTAGFCYGVKRAVEGAEKELEEKNDVYCLGEIVHNKQVIEKLKSKGIKFIENIEETMGTTIIRAHGEPKETYEIAQRQNILLKDYTCPKVLKIHNIAKQYSEDGYYIFLTGNANHPENIGTISYCGRYFSVIEKEEDVFKALNSLKKSKIKKLLIISQTTYSLEKFYIIEEIVRSELPKHMELVVNNTICKATELRQVETDKISKEVNYMIIIGGKNSSNTKKLYDIARKNCEKVVSIETIEDMNKEEICNYKKVGIMAGASTPKESIENVLDELKDKVYK